MTDFQIVHFLWLLATCLFTWLLPKRWQMDAVSLSTLLFLTTFSPWSATWLMVASFIVYGSIYTSARRQSLLIGIAILILGSAFLLFKYLASDSASPGNSIPLMIGLSYYSCRHIHVLFEVYKGNLPHIPLRRYLHYQLFLPVMLAGPIHRFGHFSRQLDRRRMDRSRMTTGAERILYGYAKLVILGNYLVNVELQNLLPVAGEGILPDFSTSALDWMYLYAAFSGYTDIALGFSLLLGIRIEENFNAPLKATNLIDFWQRWHMTLSSWCRDYVFVPVQAATRNQLLAVTCAMIAMGIWHEISLYYILWGIYHALGISLCRLYQLGRDPLKLEKMPTPLRHGLTRGATFVWLLGGMPVITRVLPS